MTLCKEQWVQKRSAPLLRVIAATPGYVPPCCARPCINQQKFLIVLSALTILYGNLCAIPQRNLKRLLGYSSIAHAGYLLMGVAAATHAGSTAIVFYLSGYLFTVIAAFTVISIVSRKADGEDITTLAGLNRRSPFLAAAMTVAMVSLAGIPPLAGFFGKFLLLKSIVEEGPRLHAYYWLAGVAILGVVVSLYYYFGIIRAIYWSKDVTDVSSITVPLPTRLALIVCLAGILFVGAYPQPLLKLASNATQSLNALNTTGQAVAQH
jgi:NADH-quinone oxidoreductase subunit N